MGQNDTSDELIKLINELFKINNAGLHYPPALIAFNLYPYFSKKRHSKDLQRLLNNFSFFYTGIRPFS